MTKLSSTTPPPNREIVDAWEHAITDLRAVEEEYTQVDALHTAAFDAADAVCPREAEFFSRYGLGCFENDVVGRERNFNSARRAVVMERCRELGRNLTFEEAEHSRAEALRIVERFDAWRNHRDDVHTKYDCDSLELRFDELVSKRWQAQNAVIQAVAPTIDALSAKLELLATMMDGEEDHERVVAIRDDAQRLLAA